MECAGAQGVESHAEAFGHFVVQPYLASVVVGRGCDFGAVFMPVFVLVFVGSVVFVIVLACSRCKRKPYCQGQCYFIVHYGND